VHVFTLLIIWLAAGVLYGMLVEDWGLVTSIYFSVAALSTGGKNLKIIVTRQMSLCFMLHPLLLSAFLPLPTPFS